MKTIKFEKKGVKFIFKNPELNEYGKLVFNYKIPKYAENKYDEEGFYANAEYDDNLGVIKFCEVKIDDMVIEGVRLPEKINKEVKELYKKLNTEREEKVNIVVNEIIEGKRPITFSIVGCDYPHYQPGLENLPKDLKGLKQYIMELSIKKLIKNELGEEPFIITACDYLEKRLKQGIATKEEINPKAFNLKFNKEKQDYYGFKDTIVTNFDMKLRDIIDIEQMKKARKEKEEREKKEKEEKAKELFIFGTDILSHTGNKMLHSLGAVFQKNSIQLYTTTMIKFMRNEGIEYNDTYKIKNILKEKGFKWNEKEKVWEIENTEENKKLVIEILKKYDTKVDPSELGLEKCWECGAWCYPSELDENGYCGC